MLALKGGTEWCIWWSLEGQKGQLWVTRTIVYRQDNGEEVKKVTLIPKYGKKIFFQLL